MDQINARLGKTTQNDIALKHKYENPQQHSPTPAQKIEKSHFDEQVRFLELLNAMRTIYCFFSAKETINCPHSI
jgi:hypothetical protein